MYFKRIEMHGFKSFAEPVVIEFHEGVTCIVGPNGSGKSNISDAIRWVLGEQSPKMLRGGKMEEVIFAGTASRKSRGMAEVTLVIDNATGILPIDYNEVAITRRMYRSGESEYLINNNQCRLRDIKELIMDTGIGVDGYSIIGQGKIADIVGNKPESRREIFEEAAGIVMYKSKKAESERKLASTNSNLERVNDIIGEIEGRIGSLKEDSVKAKEYLKLRDRYKELEINITLKNVEKLNLNNEMLKDDITELASSIEEITESKKRVDESLTTSRQKNQNLETLGNQARDELLEKTMEINRLTNKSQLDGERLSTIERDTERLSEEISSLNEKLAAELETASKLESEKQDIEKSKIIADDKLSDKVKEYNEIMSEVAVFAKKVDEGRNRTYELSNLVSSKRSEARSMESYKESLSKRKEQLTEENRTAAKGSTEAGEALSEAESGKRQAEEKLAEAIKKLSHENEALRSAETENGETLLKSDELRLKAGQLNSRKKTIEEMENNYEGYNGAVRLIMKNNTGGIKGVVADLMHVPAGYEVAVETALGGAMQNIVCEDDASAKRAINFLKNNKGGRLTFLPVASMKGNRAKPDDSLTKAQGFKGIASELVSFDSEYRGVFDYLLGRVVVVDNMDNAVALSKKSFSGLRFVTLDGEVINASGAITGGKFRNATANLLERKSEIVRLDKEISQMKSDYAKLQEKKVKSDEAILDAKAIIKDLEAGCNELRLLVMNYDTKIEGIKGGCHDMEEAQAKAQRELTNLEKDLEKAMTMTETLLSEADAAEAEINEINNTVSTDMEKWESIKVHGDNASEEITKLRIAKTSWDNKQEASTSMLTRVNLAVDDLKNQITDRQNEIQTINSEKDTLLFGSDDVSESVRTTTEEKERLEKYIAQITEEKTVLTKSIDEMTEEQTHAAEQLNSFQDQKYQQEIKLAKNETQLDTFKEKLWEEFEISYAKAMEMRQADFSMSTATKESREIRNKMKDLGDVNVGAIKEYEQVSERYEFLTEQRSDITTAMDELQAIIDDMDKTIKTKFKENFDQVVVNFETIFQELFGGGHAELCLDDEENPLEAGIEIIAQPPGKKLQNINLMSGGEKTMTAIALMFAVLKTKPTPFCILDEVEAALDDNNIDRFASYLRNFNDIQFAIVTHQKATMEHADVLYGVTMPEQGISKVLSLRLGDNFEI